MLLALLIGGQGCSRKHYRERADRAVYASIDEQSQHGPWAPEADFSIDTDPRSRLFDSSDPDDPLLPIPGPHLYGYALPSLTGQGAGRMVSTEEGVSNRASGQPGTGGGTRIGGLAIQPIPASYWDSVPEGALARMLEFESVREEYRKRYEQEPPESLRDDAERLSLGKIIELARLESRDYQSQKEQFYRAALALTRQRFDFSPRLARQGLGSNATYTHTRTGGDAADAGVVSSSLQGQQTLPTGGSIMARLANDVVLTFDGADGFSTDVGSDLLFSLNQSLLQRDVRLNPLIQAERDLVYAAREYARFRKTFFERLASQYYSLLQIYRSIEIESQNYFSLIRTFEQARAEVRFGVKNAPNQVAVDQFEQSMLSGRSGLISTWNGLEQSLDELKLTLGIPTETAINISLEELRQLTLLDEIEVAGERVQRWRSRVEDRLGNPVPNRNEILNASIFLIERLLQWSDLRRGIGSGGGGTAELDRLLAQFRVETAEIAMRAAEGVLEANEIAATRNPLILQFQGTAALIQTILNLGDRVLQLSRILDRDSESIAEFQVQLNALSGEMKVLFTELEAVLKDPRRERVEELLAQAVTLRGRADTMLAGLGQVVDLSLLEGDEASRLERTIAASRELLTQTSGLLAAADTGLLPINIQMDDAMATALVQRMDLMNERGRLADEWRQIKLAADDLKSIVNLNVSQTFGNTQDQAFRFSRNDTQTRAGLGLDLPVNRIEQRNTYRRALINYQAARRGLMAFEDNIKLDIRNRMRDMAQTRLQYPISVTRAALAAEQVTSIRLQLALGVQGVRGTDLLDALQDSRQALINVANFRIRYIIADARFAVDLESMELNEFGFWPHINDPEFQHARNVLYPESAGPTYGDIPPYLKVSRQLKRLLKSSSPGADLTNE